MILLPNKQKSMLLPSFFSEIRLNSYSFIFCVVLNKNIIFWYIQKMLFIFDYISPWWQIMFFLLKCLIKGKKCKLLLLLVIALDSSIMNLEFIVVIHCSNHWKYVIVTIPFAVIVVITFLFPRCIIWCK